MNEHRIDSERLGRLRAWINGKNRVRGGVSRRLTLIALLASVVTPLLGGVAWEPAAAAPADCQTPFLVYTDPNNPGVTSQNGDVAVTQDSVLLGEYGGNGRFAGYAIQGTMDNIATSNGMARVQGEFIATSPDGGSSITVSYTGQVDFGAAVAHGNFVAGNGTGDDAGYRASGTIEGMVVGPATLDGVDIGLC